MERESGALKDGQANIILKWCIHIGFLGSSCLGVLLLIFSTCMRAELLTGILHAILSFMPVNGGADILLEYQQQDASSCVGGWVIQCENIKCCDYCDNLENLTNCQVYIN